MAQFRSPPENVWHQFFNQGIPQIAGIVEGNRKAKTLEKRQDKEDFLLITKSLFDMASKNAVANPGAAESMFDNVLDFLGENDYGKLTEGLSMIAQGQKDAMGLQKTAKLSRASIVKQVRSGELSPGDALQKLTQLGYGDSNEAKFITKYSDDPLQYDNPQLATDMKLLKDIMMSIRDPYTGMPVEGMYETIEPEVEQIFNRVIKHFKKEPSETPPPKGGKVIWDQVWDEKNQRPYYINRETKVASWEVGAGDSVNVVVRPKKKKEAVAKFNTRESAEGGFIDIEHPMGSGNWISVREQLFQLATGANAKKSTKERLANTIGITLEKLENILK